MNNQTVVGSFSIPDELARELSDLLTKQTIRERVLDRMLQQGDMQAYDEAENMLMPIVEKVEAIKNKITSEFVPDKYRSADYVWNYNGYQISGNNVDVLTNA